MKTTMKTTSLATLILFVLVSSVFAAERKYSYSQLLDAIRAVESQGQPNNGIGAKGDGGAALGPFQIHKVYWKDATDHDPRIGGTYEDCKGYEYSLKVVRAYFDRYCRDAVSSGNWEKVSRIHNGGPNGDTKQSTKAYWLRVKAKLEGK